MAFILGFFIGLYIGVLAMSSKFKKQLNQMKRSAPVTPVTETPETFTAESLASSSDTKEN